MRLNGKSVLPVTANVRHSPHGMDHKLAVPVSFAAGILIGIPITYCLLFLPILARDKEYYPIAHHQFGSRVIRGNSMDRFNLSLQNDFIATTEDGTGRGRISVVTGPVPRGEPARTRSASSLLGLPAARKSSNAKRRESAGMVFLNIEADDLKANSETEFVKLHDSSQNNTSNLKVNSTRHSFETEDLVDGVFWTPFSEKLVPKGFDDEDIMRWRQFLNRTQVLKVEEGCGRMQNRLITLADGVKSCCRYRHNNDQIQGEIFSFYLGKLLRLQNLSPSSLALVDTKEKRWSTAASQVALAQWSSERPVVLTQFVERLKPAFIPKHFRVNNKRRLHPIEEDLVELSADEIAELVQWSDLIIFDYLTANLDRVVNNMYNERWNPDMMKQPTHNLAKTPEGLLLFLDNESGLLHGYRLLEKYEYFHRALLDGLCIFRKNTIDTVDKLHRGNNIEIALKQAFMRNDPGMSNWLPFLPERSVRTLKDRIAHVQQHVRTCKSRFSPASVFLLTPVTDR